MSAIPASSITTTVLRVELEPLVFDAADQRVGRHRLADPRLGPETLGGRAGDSGADHALPVALPRLPCRVEHDALAGPGLTDQHDHTTLAR